MRELGVGLVYWAALDPLFDPGGPAISVAEVEPESLWEQTADAAGWRYRCNDALLDRVAGLSLHKLMHGVGHPVGGTARDPLDHMSELRRAAALLQPAWVSEHLSFNRVARAGGVVEHAGFLLPPPQSAAGVRVAAHNIAEYRRALERPVAFETGVNYLQPRDGEMEDGDYFAAVAHACDSGIVLDLHNLWCNERNGRRSVAATLARLPLDRVWEIHLAGGMEESGYWLDAHSGKVPPQVLEMAANVIPTLPELGAIIFEILPEHLPRIDLDGVQRQLEELQRLWALRTPRTARVPRAVQPFGGAHSLRPGDVSEVAAWESALVGALRRTPRTTAATAGVDADPGQMLLSRLVTDFRRANLARALRYTLTTLLAALGTQGTHALLDAYFEAHAPEPFAAVEAERFAAFLRSHMPLQPDVAHLCEVLAFEHALLRATIHGVSSELAWTVDPTALFDALDAGVLPRELPTVHSAMRICAG